MGIKVVEYVHEYDEPAWEYEKAERDMPNGYPTAVYSKRVDYTSHVTEVFYAVSDDDQYRATNRDGKYVNEFFTSRSFTIQGTSLRVHSRDSVLGYIGLLNKLLDEEYPEDGE